MKRKTQPESITRHELGNGIRIVHQKIQSEVGHCGIMIHAGSRDEHADEHGLAHFIEHCIFKGTRKRKSYHILTRIDSVGGELNAYTTKEETCIYAAFPSQFGERSLELLSDITFHATFPEDEIRKEQDVIIDEIQSYQDSPSEQIFDDFEALLFPGHALGRPILGTEQSVRKLNRSQIVSFRKETMCPHGIVVSYVGPADFSLFLKWCRIYIEPQKVHSRSRNRRKTKTIATFEHSESKNTYQAHRLIGGIAPSAKDKTRTAMILLNNILGGPYMNSRLNLNIREKYGFTYNLESGYNAFEDTGVFTVYMGTEKSTLDKTHELVKRELKKLRETNLGTLQIHQAKKQLIGNMMLARDNNSAVMTGLAKSILLFNSIDSTEEIQKEIMGISASSVRSLANAVFRENNLQTLTYLP